MKENEIPVVAHLVRGYLAHTETFIGNQLVALHDYSPVVLCHHLVDGHGYPQDNVASVISLLSPRSRIFDALVYRSMRVLTSTATNALARRAISWSARLFHFHYLVDARFFLSLKRHTGLPALVSAYGYDVSWFPKRYWGYGNRYLKPVFNEIELFIAMSQDMKQDMISIGCPEEKIIVHYYGTDAKLFACSERRYDDKDVVNILVCGTLEVKKAQHIVLEALRVVEQRSMAKRRFHVTLVGDGPMRSQLERQVTDYGWQDVVTFAGFIPYHTGRLMTEYQNADIFSLPSITVKDDKEGIPGTIVEAMAAGLPVVSTYHAGIPEVIRSDQNGILVKERDIEGMARAFADLINNVALRERLGCAAAEKALNELDLHTRTKNLERIYTSLLDGRA